MTRLTHPILCALTVLVLCSCGNGGSRKPVTAEAGADAPIPFFSDASAGLEPYRLCKAVLTSQEAMDAAFPDSTDSFFEESTPATEAFYFSAADIENDPKVRRIRLRYNYVALFNRVIHSYEWFQRVSIPVDEEGPSTTKKDTLEWIQSVRPALTRPFIDSALPDAGARARAAHLMRAYDRFDGDDSEDSPFSRAIATYTGHWTRSPRRRSSVSRRVSGTGTTRRQPSPRSTPWSG